MVKDKYTATWVSYSSISDYLKCPRSYFLRNVYRDPKTNRKITYMQPALALGQVVHDVLDQLSLVPQEERESFSFTDALDRSWQSVSGEKGGFESSEEEDEYRQRASGMLTRVASNLGPLANKAIKIRQDLPYFWLSEEDNIIACGKIDWIEYLEDTDSVHIIDFKTGKYDEDPDSLQLPMYYLLATECQTRPVTRASYWYIERDDAPTQAQLPDAEEAKKRVMEAAKLIHVARKLEHFKCKKADGCMFCRPYETIIAGRAKRVGKNDFRQDIYVLN